jgi:ribosome biogenesis GTPase / thiamine phosphate phosphatase
VVSELLGTILERDGSAYRVSTGDTTVRAVLRGKAKRGDLRAVVGDVVRLAPEPGGEVFGIVAVQPRRSLLARRVPDSRGARAIAANLDHVFVVTATASPAPIPQLIDRLLAVGEANGLPVAVVLNKIDLDPGLGLERRLRAAGYEVFRTSARTGEGIDRLRGALMGSTSVVTGPSGAGKSSLLNAIQPGLRLRTGEISAKVGRGRQTTVGAVMVPLVGGGYLMDTPGFSEVGLWGIEPGALAECFPEMRPLIGRCRYADCRHVAEPGCGVRAAVAAGQIAADRYQSYRALLEEIESQPEDWE